MNIASKLDTGTPFLQGLIQDIKQGEIKIPKFQRRFVWKPKQALDLLDSIANNYPIGSLLLWKTSIKLVAERNIGDFTLPETDEITPTNYVLDGQQRLTVIYSCLGAPISEKGFAVGYDLLKEGFIELPREHRVHIFPLRLMYATSKLLDYRTALKSHPESELLQQRLDLIIQVITNYKIPVVSLKDLTVEEVCPIFERINSSGTRLSTYDLMVAATWSESFDLNDETQKIASSLQPKGFGDINGNTVIKCLSTLHKKSVARDDILGLRHLKSSEIDSLVTKAKESLLKVVDLLSTEFKIYSWDFLPYEALVIILCSIFSEVKSFSVDEVKRVREWFWRASFAERYRGASDTFISSDIKAVKDYVTANVGAANYFGEPPLGSALRSVQFRSDNSRSRAFILALASRHPRNLTNGVRIDTTEALSAFNKKQYHHIYPTGYLKRIGSDKESNSLLNICMLTAAENNRISDSDPNQYIVDSISTLGADAQAVFESNLLPSPSQVNYASLDYSAFLPARGKIVSEVVAKLCQGNPA